MRVPEEIKIERDKHEKDRAEHGLDDAAAARIPASEPAERRKRITHGKPNGAADRLEDAGEERDDWIEHGGTIALTLGSRDGGRSEAG